MGQFEPRAYGPVFAPLLETDRRRPLDGGTPDRGVRPALERLDVKTAFAHAARKLADREMAACCWSALWLLHDYLDESHRISQSIKSASGSYWHAIMHRREGDFSNAKYWFHHVDEHPVFEPLASRAAEIAAERGKNATKERLVVGDGWDPDAFVDLCQAAQRDSGELHELCLDVQHAEWELLFDFCYRAAVEN